MHRLTITGADFVFNIFHHFDSASTVGVIYKVERGFARVVDQSGMTREVEPHLILQKRDSSRAIATDGEGNSIQDGDSVREMGGGVSFLIPL